MYAHVCLMFNIFEDFPKGNFIFGFKTTLLDIQCEKQRIIICIMIFWAFMFIIKHKWLFIIPPRLINCTYFPTFCDYRGE